MNSSINTLHAWGMKSWIFTFGHHENHVLVIVRHMNKAQSGKTVENYSTLFGMRSQRARSCAAVEIRCCLCVVYSLFSLVFAFSLCGRHGRTLAIRPTVNVSINAHQMQLQNVSFLWLYQTKTDSWLHLLEVLCFYTQWELWSPKQENLLNFCCKPRREGFLLGELQHGVLKQVRSVRAMFRTSPT